MEPRSAFARARSFLDFTAGHKWTSRLAAVATAVATLGLFVILGLFIDLLIHRGHVPNFTELNVSVRKAYKNQIDALTPDQRKEQLAALQWPESRRGEFNEQWQPLTASAQEGLWRAYVHDMFRRRIGEAAAATYRQDVINGDPPLMGALGMVVRQPGIAQRCFGWLASWNSWMWRPGASGQNTAYLVGLMLVAAALAVIRAAAFHWMHHAAAVSTLDGATRLRRAIYHHSNRLGTLALREGDDTESATIFVKHIQNVHDALFTRLTTFFHEPITLILLVLFALALDFWVGLACIMLAGVVILLGGYFAARFRDRAQVEARRAAAQMQLLQESLSMMRLVKSNLMDAFNQTRVERQLADHADAAFRRFRGESLFKPLLLFLGTLAGVMALALAGYAVLVSGAGPGKLALMAATLTAAYFPLARILEDRRVLRKGRESAVPVFDFLDRPGEVGQVVGAEFLSGINNGIEYRAVSLREPRTGRLLLNDINLRIGAGQRVAIVGPDDAEKHALVYLLVRFLDATTGEIRIDDKSLRWLTLESLRAQIGLVMWNNLIFNDTVANNISCGDSSVTLPQIIECAKIAHAHQFIARLPQGYETPIGEFGNDLRASEKFRIALARAILKDSSVYVIEEPATPFDEDRKGLVDDALERVLPGKTVIFLAHRISTIRSCDVVYLIHRGQVEAAGEHRELLATSDLYKHLHYLEFNEFSAAKA